MTFDSYWLENWREKGARDSHYEYRTFKRLATDKNDLKCWSLMSEVSPILSTQLCPSKKLNKRVADI